MTSRLGDRVDWLCEVAPKLTPVQWQVLAYQCLRLTDRKGKHWHATATIADHLGLSERTVRRAQLDLEHKGLVARRFRYRPDGGKRSTVIYVLSPGVHPDEAL